MTIESTTGIIPATKIEQKWKVLRGKKGEFAYVTKNQLHFDHENYQRIPAEGKITLMAREWSWIACGAISVARRQDGSLWVMDGQYRTKAALKRSDIHDLPCMIFDVHDVKTEAEGFIDLNTRRKVMRFTDQFKAMITAEDKIAIFTKELIDSVDRTISPGVHRRGITCVSALYDWVRKDQELTIRMWPILDKVCGDAMVPVRVLNGLFYLEHVISPETSLADDRYRKRIIDVGIHELVTAVKKACEFYGSGSPPVCAYGILIRINKNLTANKIIVKVPLVEGRTRNRGNDDVNND